MRSIRARLILLYALSTTASIALLFAVGYQLLETQLSNGLDRLVTLKYREIKDNLGDDLSTIDSEELARRVQHATDYASTLFYIEIEAPKTTVRFESSNLAGAEIPDVPGKRLFDATVSGLGGMRVHEFLVPPFDVTVATPTKQLHQTMEAYTNVSLALLVAMLAVSTGIGFGLSRLVLRPLRLISNAARQIQADNLSERIEVANVKDEISDLSQLLNAAFDRIETAFDQVRRFSDEASHELKTPLSLIRLHAEKILKDPGLAPAHTEAIVVQLDEIRRLNQIIDDLLFLSRAEAQAIVFDMRAQDPKPLLESFMQDAGVLGEHFGCQVKLQCNGIGEVACEAKWIRQVLLNALTNALHVSPKGRTVTLDSEVDTSRWRVRVIDEGPGLSQQQRDVMFDRFVRFHTRSDEDRGSGLGLAICKKIIELHDGIIYAHASTGSGLELCFEIPAVAPHDRAAVGVTPAFAR